MDQIRPDKMSGLIWIQTVWHSYGIPERFFLKKLMFKKIQMTKKHAKVPSTQRVKKIHPTPPQPQVSIMMAQISLNQSDWSAGCISAQFYWSAYYHISTQSDWSPGYTIWLVRLYIYTIWLVIRLHNCIFWLVRTLYSQTIWLVSRLIIRLFCRFCLYRTLAESMLQMSNGVKFWLNCVDVHADLSQCRFNMSWARQNLQ